MSTAQREDAPSDSREAEHKEYTKDVKVYFYLYSESVTDASKRRIPDVLQANGGKER